MNSFLIDSLGYVALVINLYSMSVQGEHKLRKISLVANLLYIIYGYSIQATPVMVGCSIAVVLHAYRLRQLKTNSYSND